MNAEKEKWIIIIFLLLALCRISPVLAETKKNNFQFIDQKYSDILYALSSWSGIPIVADETVSGTASFQFAGAEFEKAFESFLAINRLYVEKKQNVWTVSRILAKANTDGQTISIDALDASPSQILDRLSRLTGISILYDVIPSTKISIHIASATQSEITSLVLKPFTGYMVENSGSNIVIRRVQEAASALGPPTATSSSRMSITHSGALYSAQINQARVSEIFDRLCGEESTSYSSFLKNDPVITGIKVAEKSFDELLSIVLEQSGAEKVEKNGVLYFIPLSGENAADKIRELNASWTVHSTTNIKADKVIPLLASRFPGIKTLPVQNSDTFLIYSDNSKLDEIESFINLIDRNAPNDLIKLKYISTAEFMKVLPPSVKKEDLTDTGTGNSFFFRGPPELKNEFLDEITEIDKPKTRIRYDMLIIQYDESSDLSWECGADINRLESGDITAVAGNFGSLLGLKFDVISLFGYRFSAKLNASLADNHAQVFADTTLHGISGENIKFQNTSTYRYRDSNVDPETGKSVYTGITREIISGVVLEINGWASGDGMVTMNINASVSKRGADVSTRTGNPPTTSEKIISTKLNTANGEPVILSGLTQNDSSIVEQRVPFISRIPLLGWIFRDLTSTQNKNEMIIYIVPHITNESDAEDESDRLALTAYDRIIKPLLPEDTQ